MNQKKYTAFERYLFDRKKLRSEESFCNEWFNDEQFEDNIEATDETIVFITHVYDHIEELAQKYTPVNICLGLQYIIDSSCSRELYDIFFNEKIDAGLRFKATRSMHGVFARFFNTACRNALTRDLPLYQHRCNYLCYMWWDFFPMDDASHKEGLAAEIPRILKRSLCLDNLACKESALHGLARWHAFQPEETKSILVEAREHIPPQLKEYAQAAMRGELR